MYLNFIIFYIFLLSSLPIINNYHKLHPYLIKLQFFKRMQYYTLHIFICQDIKYTFLFIFIFFLQNNQIMLYCHYTK